MTKILMVCLGNICRSPLAHGILESKLSQDLFYVDSAGTANYHVGQRPDSRSIAVAKSHGLDISTQSGRQFKIADFDMFDVIYVMDNSNYQNVIKLARNNGDIAKVKLILGELDQYPLIDVPDPYYGGDDGFENVYKMLDLACSKIHKALTSQLLY